MNTTPQAAQAQPPADPFKPAERQNLRARILVVGPSKSGKTLGALAVARGMVGAGQPVAVLDSEMGRSRQYADLPGLQPYRVLAIGAPYRADRLAAAIRAAAQAGYAALIVDGVSPWWEGEGGVQEIADQNQQGNNKWSGWSEATKHYRAIVGSLSTAPLHVVCTARVRVEWAVDERGKPRKIGLKPVMRDGFDYEFDLVATLAEDHSAKVEARGTFQGRELPPDDGLGAPEPFVRLGHDFVIWLGSLPAASPQADPGPAPEAPSAPAPAAEPAPAAAPPPEPASPAGGADGASADPLGLDVGKISEAPTPDQQTQIGYLLAQLAEQRPDVDFDARVRAKLEELYGVAEPETGEQAATLIEVLQTSLLRVREAAS